MDGNSGLFNIYSSFFQTENEYEVNVNELFT